MPKRAQDYWIWQRSGDGGGRGCAPRRTPQGRRAARSASPPERCSRPRPAWPSGSAEPEERRCRQRQGGLSGHVVLGIKILSRFSSCGRAFAQLRHKGGRDITAAAVACPTRLSGHQPRRGDGTASPFRVQEAQRVEAETAAGMGARSTCIARSGQYPFGRPVGMGGCWGHSLARQRAVQVGQRLVSDADATGAHDAQLALVAGALQPGHGHA